MKDSMATSKPVSWRRKRILDLLSSYQTRGRENSPNVGTIFTAFFFGQIRDLGLQSGRHKAWHVQFQ